MKVVSLDHLLLFFSLASSASVGYQSRLTYVSMCISHCTFGELCVSGEER